MTEVPEHLLQRAQAAKDAAAAREARIKGSRPDISGIPDHLLQRARSARGTVPPLGDPQSDVVAAAVGEAHMEEVEQDRVDRGDIRASDIAGTVLPPAGGSPTAPPPLSRTAALVMSAAGSFGFLASIAMLLAGIWVDARWAATGVLVMAISLVVLYVAGAAEKQRRAIGG